MKTKSLNIISIVFLFLFTLNTYILSQTGIEIMTLNDNQQSTKSESVKLTMILINKSGKKRTRQVERFTTTDKDDNRSSLIRFLYPADVKGTGYLEIEHTDKNDDGWLYLPALDRSRRISTGDETDNFMSSEFTYEDLGTEDLEHYKYTLMGSKTIEGIDCYHILAEPSTEKKKKESGYSKRELYITKNHHITKKIDFYNKSGVLIKQFLAENIKQVQNTEKWRSYKMTMRNLKTRYSTILEFEDFKIDEDLNSDIFTLRYLENK